MTTGGPFKYDDFSEAEKKLFNPLMADVATNKIQPNEVKEQLEPQQYERFRLFYPIGLEQFELALRAIQHQNEQKANLVDIQHSAKTLLYRKEQLESNIKQNKEPIQTEKSVITPRIMGLGRR